MAKRPWLVPGGVILLGRICAPLSAVVRGIAAMSLRYDQAVSLVTRRGSR